MKKTVVRVVALDMIFLLLLTVSGAFSGVPSDILYIAAYLLPLAAFPWLTKGEKGEKLLSAASAGDMALCLPLVAPTISITIGLSALVTYLLSFAGIGGTEALTGPVFELLILHALVPAVLEETLFRYVPLTLIAPYSKRSAVIVSALLFAVAHCNLAQLPYAFVAGIIFAVIDIAVGSIIPSVVMHLLNNVASVFWLWEVSAQSFRLPFAVSILIVSVISVVLVIVFRRRYAEKTSFLVDKTDKISTSREVWLFALVCTALAVGSLL